MALVLANRVQETGTANTTVSFTLAGAVTGFQTFATIGNTNTTYYSATDASGNWEVGLGTYSTTGPTLTRTTILASSNAGSAVTFSGTVNVFVTQPSNVTVVNTASGTNAIAVGGSSNSASGSGSAIIGGSTNTATTTNCSVVGGDSNNAQAISAGVFAGSNNTANGAYSCVIGGAFGTTRGIIGNLVYTACNDPLSLFTAGRAQNAVLTLVRQTTTATPTVLTSNANAAGFTNQVVLPTNSAYYVRGSCIANVTGGGNTKAWSFEAAIKQGASAATTAIVGAVIKNVVAADAGASTWDITISADTTNGALSVSVTGQASTTIRWVCKVESTEVTY